MKPRIFCLLRNETELRPISGDRINEIFLAKAMAKNFDVFYNGVKVNPEDEVLGRSDKRFTVPQKGEYDLVYVRANREIFLKSPHPKIWFASPYDKDCFEVADGIACMTEPWKERLKVYSPEDHKYFDEAYPTNMPAPDFCLLFPQSIEVPDLYKITSERNVVQQKNFFAKLFSSKNDSKFKINHFGPIRESNYPHQLIRLLKRESSLLKKVHATAVGPGKKFNLPKCIETKARIPKAKVLSHLLDANAIWYNQHHSGNIAGSLKVLEAMALGKVVLAPKWDARVRELGEDYPFFWQPDLTAEFSQQDGNHDEKFRLLINSDPDFLAEVGLRLHERSHAFSIDGTATILNREISQFIDRVR